MNDLDDSILLSNFVADCHLPETVQVVEGYESLDSEELSWCRDEIVNLHALKEVSRIIAQDKKGCSFSIPLTYPGKIFEIIPVKCADQYETVQELFVPFPKYVRSLRDIPKNGIAVGDIIELIEPSRSGRGRKDLKCKVMGKTSIVSLSSNQLGPFESLGDTSPRCIEEVLNQPGLPTRVRVLASKAKAFNESNRNPLVPFEGSFTLEQAVKQKVIIVSTLVEKHLRILKMPVDLEITVKRTNLNIHPHVLSHICHLIESVQDDINSTITCGSTGDASWYFDNISDDIYETLTDDNSNIYEELRPLVPPRTSPSKPLPDGSRSKQNTINKKFVEARYAPPPKPKLLKKPSLLAIGVQKNSNIMQAAPPRPVTKKPTQSLSSKPVSSETVISKRNIPGQLVSQTVRESDSVPCPTAEPQNPPGTSTVVQREEKESTSKHLQKVDDTNASEVDEGGVRTYEAISEVLSKQTVADGKQDLRHHHMSNEVPHQMAPFHQQEDPALECRKRLENLSVSEVGERLKELGLSQYVKLFEREEVDGTMLLELNDEMIQCIGIDNALHRKKLMMFVQRGWTPKRN